MAAALGLENKRKTLHSIQNKGGIVRSSGGNRKHETVMISLIIGYSNLNSTLHIIGEYPIVFCDQCQVPETVEQICIKEKGYDGRGKIPLVSFLTRTGLIRKM